MKKVGPNAASDVRLRAKTDHQRIRKRMRVLAAVALEKVRRRLLAGVKPRDHLTAVGPVADRCDTCGSQRIMPP
jgi:hypothetical protein